MIRSITFAGCPLLLLAAVVWLGPVGQARAADSPPNIIFVFTDDHATHAIGAYGSKINKTPNMDRLAAEGMLFENCFVTNSICAPSRAVILTGKHSHLNGVVDNRATFDGSQQTFPKILQAAGYQTAMIGKWHLKSEPTGFDFWKVLPGQGLYYNPTFRTPEGTVKEEGYVTDIITDTALDWLKNKRDGEKPFMLMYQHKAPHREWAPGPDHLTMYDDVTIPEPDTLFDDYEGRSSAAKQQEMTIKDHMSDRDLKFVQPRGLTEEQSKAWDAAYGPKNEAFEKANLEGDDIIRWRYQRYIKDYLRTIASVDDNLGRVLDYLDEAGLAENTVVIYSSDQGFYLGDHGWYDKRWMYDESLRMPLIVRWPGVTEPGARNENLVQNLDFAPTFLKMAGAEVPEDIQGESLVPLLKGEEVEWRDAVYYHYWEFPAVHMVNRHYGVRTDRFKLIYYYELDEWELFDLEIDPDELKSVHHRENYAEVLERLKTKLADLQREALDLDPTAPRDAVKQQDLERTARRQKLVKALALDEPGQQSIKTLDPSAKPIVVGAWVRLNQLDGVIAAQGGEALGYALYVKNGAVHFGVRDNGKLTEAVTETPLELDDVTHVAGILTASGELQVWVDGEKKASEAGQLISNKPSDPLTIAADLGSRVGEYTEDLPLDGDLRDLRIYWGNLGKAEFSKWARR